MLASLLRRAVASIGLAVAGVFAAACVADTPLAPTQSAPDAPSFRMQRGIRQGGGRRHVIVLRRAAMPAELRRAIEARGGVVEWSDTEIGVATVRGLNDVAVAELAARSEVEGIDADVRVQWLRPGERYARSVMRAPGVLTDQSGAFFFDVQWNMRQIRADAAWLTTRQGSGALVCILDTGIDPDHIDLAGKVDLAKSKSFVAAEPEITDYNTHGTAVASLVSSNGLGMASVAPDADLCAVKVLDGTGEGSFADIIAGMMHAARAGADVINMSLGAYFSLKEPGALELVVALQRAVIYADRKGTLVVASSGNEGINLDRDPRDFISVPAQLLRVMSVGATAPFNQMDFDALATYTNYGRSGVDVMAPGGDFLEDEGGQVIDLVLAACSQYQTDLPFSCEGGDSYILGAGTSFAAPHAAGTAAVAESERRRDQDGGELARCVEKGADDLGQRGFDPFYGHGRINVLGAAGCRAGHKHGHHLF